MKLLYYFIGVLLFFSVTSCDLLGLPEEATIIYDVTPPPNIPPSLSLNGKTVVSLAENSGTDTITVSIGSQPMTDGTVVVVFSNPDPSRYTISPETLTFTNSSWAAQDVTISSIDNLIQDGNSVTSIKVSTTGTDWRYNEKNFVQSVQVTVIDDDIADYTITETAGSTGVTEAGGTDTLDVVLNTLPSSSVTISLTGSDSTESTFLPTQLTFTTANWNTPQTVTFTGQDDSVQDGAGTNTITFTVDSGLTADANYLAIANKTVAVSTSDDDVAGFTMTQTGGSTGVTEMGGTDSITVVLDSEPTSDVVIDFVSTDSSEVTLSPSSLTFSTGNYSTAQTITFTGQDDFIDDSNTNTTVNVNVNAGTVDTVYAALAQQTISVSNTDNDSAGISVSESGGSTYVEETGDTDYISVVLDTEPLGNVVLDVTSSDTTEITVDPATLTFTPLDWNVGQNVGVTGVDDNVSEDNVTVNNILNINVASTLDSQYDLLGTVTVPVIVTDNDIAGFTLGDTADIRTFETGATDTFTIVLNTQPTANVVFNITSVTTTEVAATTSTVTFNAGNWNVPQTVTVTGVDDVAADGNTTNTVTVSIDTVNTLDNFYDPVLSQNVSVTNNDNDVVGFTAVPEYGSIVSENGSTTTYTIVLDSLPSGNVIIDATSNDTGEMTVSPASLTFTTGNWNTPQTVTITGVDDLIDDGTVNVNVNNNVNAGSADASYVALGTVTVVASTVDDDTAGLTLTLSSGSNAVSEPNTTDTFTLELDTEPTGNVVIDLTSTDTGEVTVSPATATFNAGNWNSPQTITLTGVDDAIVDSAQSASIILSIDTASTADTAYDLVDNVTTAVTIADDDSLGITISPTSATLAEGATQVVGVTIDAQPSANVVIDIASANPNEVTVDTATMTFNAGNWNVAQNVTVTAVNDAVDDGNTTTNVDFQIDQGNTADPVWLATADVNMSVTSTDDDTANFTVTETGGSTSTDETGSTDTVTIVLTSQPTDVVVIDVSIAGGDSTEVSLSSSRFTFQPASWNTAQTLVLTGLDETEADGNIANTINFDINTGLTLDSTYDSVGQKTVTNTNVDNDNIGITLVCCGSGGPGTSNGTAGPISEDAGSNTMTVVLNSQPSGNVVLDVVDLYTTLATSSPAQLTFTTANWDTPQTVTTSSVDDNIYREDPVAITRIDPNAGLSADAAYGALGNDSRRYKIINENDVRGLTFDLGDGVSVTELGTTDTFTVVMDIPPQATQNAVIDIASANTSEVTVSPAQVTFTDGNYNSPQTITVTGVNDFSTDGNQVVNITFTSNATSSDDYYDSVFSESVAVTNEDDDNPGITFTETGGSTLLNEDGTTDTFTVVLTSLPALGNVVIDITDNDATEIAAITPNQLTFTNMDWNIAQTVTLTPADDALADNTVGVTITGALNFSTTDGVYSAANPTATLTANVADDDAIGYTVACCVTAGGGVGTNSGNAVALNESSGTDNFTVVLNSQPTGNVVFDIIDSSATQAGTSPSRLTFTTANWNTPQAVATAPITDDIDEVNLDVTATVDPNSSLSADAAYGGLGNTVVWFNVVDDDTVGYTVSTTTISVSENATTQSFTVVLDSEPTGDVEFDITNPDTTEVALSDNVLIFTSANWDTAQTINVTGVNDDLDDNDITFNVVVAIDAPNTADGAYDLLGSTNISVTNVDNDDPALVTLASNTGGLSENGGSVTIQANQDIAVGANTTVTIGVTGGTASAGEYSLASSNITITAGTLQGTTTITGVDDTTDETTETIVIEITGVSGGVGATEDGTQSITLNLNDDDNAGFTIAESGGSTTLSENGGTDTFTVVLDTTPTGNVRINFTFDDTTEISISPVALIFTSGNWNTPQTVTVTGVDDQVDDGNVNEEIVASIDTGITNDNIYDAVGSQTVTATITDDDNPGIASFSLSSIERDFNRLILNWAAPSSGFDTSDSSSDKYILYYTTVAPENRTPAGRMINETDNKTRDIAASKISFVHGNLSQQRYYYRLAAVDNNNKMLFTTNELNAIPYPVECTGTTGFLADNDPDLLAYYPMEGNYTDQSPQNGRTAAMGWPYDLEEGDESTGIGFSDGCAYGQAAYFDGGGTGQAGKGTFLKNLSFTGDGSDITPNFTVSMWIQPDGDMEQYASVLSSGSDNKDPEFQIHVNDYAQPLGRISVFERKFASRTAVSNEEVKIGTWYHIAMSAEDDGDILLYVNGILQEQTGRGFMFECNSSTTPSCSTTKWMWDKIYVGRNRQGKEKWKGYIDEVKIYNRAFTAAEITALYNLSLPPIPENVTAASVGGGSADITLTWDAVPGSTSYTLYRVENSVAGATRSIIFNNQDLVTTGTNITEITNVQAGCTTGTCTYTDSDPGLTFNRFYNYRIAAVNAIGTGNPGPATEVSAQAL